MRTKIECQIYWKFPVSFLLHSLYPQLPVPDSPEHLLDFWAPGPNPPHQDLSPQPPPQPVPLGPRTPTSPTFFQVPVLTSFTVEDLQGALRPDLQARGIQVICVNVENQEINLVETPRKGKKVRFAVSYNSSYFPGLCNQGLSASDIPMQYPLRMYPGPPLQRIHVPWTAADLLNYKTLLLPLSEDPTKFREELERLVAIHSPTHRDLDWLLRGVLPSHDYTVVIRQARRPPSKNPPHRGNTWPDPLPDPPADNQEVAQLRADIQGLIGAILEAFPPKLNRSKIELCTQNEGEQHKAFVERFIQTFQRHTALNL